ncbi:MAG TPA: DUF72 domain-containing protein [Thermoanaerobaculia bacterium]|jgi:uncharacterized protein YecE (DUF72 family)
MAENILRVGTAGWSYEDWSGIVYPGRPPRGFDRLAAMAALFDSNEINSTFYRIPDARQTADWARRVDFNARFRFTAKLFRGFTHEKEPGAGDGKAFREAMHPLVSEGRLGAVLVQFPYSFHGTAENRTRLVSLLEKLEGLPLAVEFRHDSWDSDGTARLLSEREAAFVNIDQPDLPGNLRPTNRVTSSIAYYRFHGRNTPKWFGPDTSNVERYNYLYSPDELAPWLERIRDGARRAAERAAASSRDGGAYAILNNHFRGQAVANALELQEALTGRRRPAPDSLFETYPALAKVADRAAAGQRRLF